MLWWLHCRYATSSAKWVLTVLLSLVWVVDGQGTDADQWLWPVALKPALSSSFGETRSTSFHAGIDVKTWGRTGYAVKAVADGYIWRLRTSPWGYGRAVYQKLADGRIVVYAHLQAFNEVIAAQVEKAQEQQGHYSTDQWFAAGQLVVKRGEVIAYSGQSGAGPPHLHVELRDANNLPINPLVHGFRVEDTVAPTIKRLALIPQGRNSQVNGTHEPVVVDMHFDAAQDAYVAADTLRAYGSIGLGVEVYDRADGVNNKLAPYRQRLVVDQVPVFTAAYQRFSYSDTYQVLLDRTVLAVAGGQAVFFNMFKYPGNRLTFYTLDQQDGWLQCTAEGLGQGVHWLEVESADAVGNVQRARLALWVNSPPRLVESRFIEAGDQAFIEAELADVDDNVVQLILSISATGEQWSRVQDQPVAPGSGPFTWNVPRGQAYYRIQVRDAAGGEDFRIFAFSKEPLVEAAFGVTQQPYADFVELTVQSPVVLAQPLLAVAQHETLQVKQVDIKTYRLALGLESEGDTQRSIMLRGSSAAGQALESLVPIQQRPVFPTRTTTQLMFDSTAVLSFPEQSVYELFFAHGFAYIPHNTEGWGSDGRGYRFAPTTVSFNRKIGVWLRYSDQLKHPEKLGLYALSHKGSWHFIGNEHNTADRLIGARVRQLGTYALLADTTAPLVDHIEPVPGSSLTSRRPSLLAHIVDTGAGIGREEDIIMQLDEKRLISEYDPEAQQVVYQLKKDLVPGQHQLRLQVSDRSGNQTTRISQFTIVP